MSKELNGNGIQQAANVTRQKASGTTTLDLLTGRTLDMQIAMALTGTGVDPVRFKRVVLTALRLNPDLASCSQASILGAMMTAAQLGLEPNTPMGLCYLIPYKRECTLQLGYKGLIELARRSKRITQVQAHAVYEGDEFEFELGLHSDIRHKPVAENREDASKITHVYAYARFGDGSDPVFVVLTRKKVESYRRRSHMGNSGAWVSDYEAMAMKTAVKRLATWLPLSPQAAEGIQADEGIARYDASSGETLVQPAYDLPQEQPATPTVTANVTATKDIYATEGGSADEG